MEGNLVRLSPIAGDEDYALLGQWMASPIAAYANGAPQLMSAPQVKAFLDAVPVNYLMIRMLDGTTIGSVNWQQMSYAGNYAVGCSIADPKLWGAGYGVESMILLLEYLFHTLNAHRLHFLGGLHNLQIVKLYLTGIVHVEGVLRDYFFVDGEYHDAIVGSILRHEYYEYGRTLGIPNDVIPKAEKEEARQLLRQHLSANPIEIAVP